MPNCYFFPPQCIHTHGLSHTNAIKWLIVLTKASPWPQLFCDRFCCHTLSLAASELWPKLASGQVGGAVMWRFCYSREYNFLSAGLQACEQLLAPLVRRVYHCLSLLWNCGFSLEEERETWDHTHHCVSISPKLRQTIVVGLEQKASGRNNHERCVPL